jgi:ELWxxDGT repeat protein
LADVDGTLFFQAFTRANGVRLWKTDGTGAGTTLVSALGGGPTDFAGVDGILFFTAADPTHGRELWAVSTSCGDGIRNAAEACDLGVDHNGAAGFCCTARCQISAGLDVCSQPEDANGGESGLGGDTDRGGSPGLGEDTDRGGSPGQGGGADAGVCGTGGFATLECRLNALLSDQVCGDEPLPKSIRRIVQKKTRKARNLTRKAAGTKRPRKQRKLLGREERLLRAMLRKVNRAGANDRISAGCRQAIEGHIEALHSTIEALRSGNIPSSSCALQSADGGLAARAACQRSIFLHNPNGPPPSEGPRIDFTISSNSSNSPAVG